MRRFSGAVQRSVGGAAEAGAVERYCRWQKCPNVLERDYRLKIAMGFDEEHFTRMWGLLRK